MQHLIEDTSDDHISLSLKAKFETLQKTLNEKKRNASEIDERSNEHITQMAMSTAIAAQKAIDGLLHGITELEDMLLEDDFESESTNNDAKSNNSISEIKNLHTVHGGNGVKIWQNPKR
jgi:hypothetical protein